MKAGLIITLALSMLGATRAWAVRPGDTRVDVVTELGKPTGFIRIGNEETLYFERGSVQLRGGKVVTADLISAEEVRERRLAAERAEAEQARVAAETRARLKVEGEAVLKVMLADPEFIAAGPEIQVARWRDFMQKYPDVPVAEYYLPALKRYSEIQTHGAQDQRIAELEWQVKQAEYKAQTMVDDAQYYWQYPPFYIVSQQPWSLWYSSRHHGAWSPSRGNEGPHHQSDGRGGPHATMGAGTATPMGVGTTITPPTAMPKTAPPLTSGPHPMMDGHRPGP